MNAQPADPAGWGGSRGPRDAYSWYMDIAARPETIPDRAQLGAALRDLENAKARVERDAGRVADETRTKLVSQLVPLMDNLDRTIRAATDSGDAPAVVEGIGLVKTQLEAVLRGYGVERIDAVGERFDPAVHEAVTTRQVPTAGEHDQVVEQLSPGYRVGTQLLRAAQVVVGKQSAAMPEPAVMAEPRPVPPPQYVDSYGRRVDRDGRLLRVAPLDAWGRPIRLDAYGRPVPQSPAGGPFARRFR